MSTYHYLLEKTDIFDGATVCRQGVSCTTQWINWFGFVTIPFLALIGFLIITIMSIIALVNHEPVGEDEEGDPLRTPWLRVTAPVVVVLAVFAVLFITGAAASPGRWQHTWRRSFPVANVTPVAAVNWRTPNHSPAAGAWRQLFREACAACHGIDAQGCDKPGQSAGRFGFRATARPTRRCWRWFAEGRDLSNPANTTGLVMPPKRRSA